MKMLPLLVLLAATTVPTYGKPLCGHSAANRAELEATLRKTARVFDRDKQITTIFESNRTLWWLTKPAHPAFPALVCMQQVVRGPGYVRLPPQSDCGGAPKALCSALVQRMSRVEY
jgi:hypothetical protein